jgi:glycolate dehydrogenase FAD-binding subunit
VACVAGRSHHGDDVSAHAPSEGAKALAERVRAARASATPLRIVGAGTWLHAGRPCRATETLDLREVTGAGIVEYQPGDLTLTARAATSLAEIERITRAEGQWLPLDPHGTREGTLGATVATASAGPVASAYGAPRDQLLGCEFVTGAGDVVHAGGKVVKNVAGFDLVRLVTGAWGTLGALTEVTVRLRALPEVDRTLALETTADDAWRWLRASEYSPIAAELLTPAIARALGVGGESGATLLLRLGGNAALVRAAAESIGALSGGALREVDASVWPALAANEPHDAAVVRLSTLPSRVGALWERASAIVERVGGYAHATLKRGVVRCIIPSAGPDVDENARLRGIITTLRIDATCIAERLPPSLWAALMPPTATDLLSTRARDAFDPDRILNPGILGESLTAPSSA